MTWKAESGLMRSRIFVSQVLADSVARPTLQGLMQFNGTYGCSVCTQKAPGHVFHQPSGTRNTAKYRVDELWRRKLDQHLNLRGNCKRPLASPKLTDGIQDWSPLVILPYFDLVQGKQLIYFQPQHSKVPTLSCLKLADFPLCPLHFAYEGIMKQFLSLWCNSNKKDEEYYLCLEDRRIIDAGIKGTQVPYRVSRPPRPLAKRLKYKGHELNVFLFHLSPILLKSRFNSRYYNNWLDLVHGLSLLNRTNPSEVNINDAEKHLRFLKALPALYGEETVMHFNVHLLNHVSWIVRNKSQLCLHTMI